MEEEEEEGGVSDTLLPRRQGWGVGGQCTTELSGSALMFPKSRVESVSSSISPITALKHSDAAVNHSDQTQILCIKNQFVCF